MPKTLGKQEQSLAFWEKGLGIRTGNSLYLPQKNGHHLKFKKQDKEILHSFASNVENQKILHSFACDVKQI